MTAARMRVRMMMRMVVLAGLCALLTWFAGWWAVLVVAFVAGVLWRHDQSARIVAVSAVLAWSALLVVDTLDGGLGALSHVVSAVFGVPDAVMLAITLVFIALGAWSAATLGVEIARRLGRAHQRRAIDHTA